jgi:hypothetical protein
VRSLIWLLALAVPAATGLTTTPAEAAPSALINIVTAESLGKHQFVPDLIFVYDPSAPVTANSFTVDTEFGLGDGWEAGYDFAPDAPLGGAFNIKKTFNFEQRTRWALGAYNIDPAALNTTVPYVVASRDSHDAETTFHGGLLYDTGVQGFGGLCHRLGNDTCLWTDYMTGPNGMYTAGVDFTLGSRTDFTIGAMLLNGGGFQIYTDTIWTIDW